MLKFPSSDLIKRFIGFYTHLFEELKDLSHMLYDVEFQVKLDTCGSILDVREQLHSGEPKVCRRSF